MYIRFKLLTSFSQLRIPIVRRISPLGDNLYSADEQLLSMPLVHMDRLARDTVLHLISFSIHSKQLSSILLRFCITVFESESGVIFFKSRASTNQPYTPTIDNNIVVDALPNYQYRYPRKCFLVIVPPPASLPYWAR